MQSDLVTEGPRGDCRRSANSSMHFNCMSGADLRNDTYACKIIIRGVIARNGPTKFFVVKGAHDRDAATPLWREPVERMRTFGHHKLFF